MSESASKAKPPILYSFRRCPYAIRARMAIACAGIQVELREVVLRQLPEAMLAISPKATVPVLQLTNGKVIDESLDIMHWALAVNDKEDWLAGSVYLETDSSYLTEWNDGEFKYYLDRYKYADRFPQHDRGYYRGRAENFLHELQRRLTKSQYLGGARLSFTDVAVFPFIRQFAAVDSFWFEASRYGSVAVWLRNQIESDLFVRVMQKYKAWQPAEENSVLFGRECEGMSRSEIRCP